MRLVVRLLMVLELFLLSSKTFSQQQVSAKDHWEESPRKEADLRSLKQRKTLTGTFLRDDDGIPFLRVETSAKRYRNYRIRAWEGSDSIKQIAQCEENDTCTVTGEFVEGGDPYVFLEIINKSLLETLNKSTDQLIERPSPGMYYGVITSGARTGLIWFDMEISYADESSFYNSAHFPEGTKRYLYKHSRGNQFRNNENHLIEVDESSFGFTISGRSGERVHYSRVGTDEANRIYERYTVEMKQQRGQTPTQGPEYVKELASFKKWVAEVMDPDYGMLSFDGKDSARNILVGLTNDPPTDLTQLRNRRKLFGKFLKANVPPSGIRGTEGVNFPPPGGGPSYIGGGGGP